MTSEATENEKPGSKPLRKSEHEVFAQSVAAGSTKTDAFLEIRPHAANWKPEAVHVKAAMLGAREDVKARVRYLSERAADEAVFTRATHLARLNALSIAAERAGDFGPAVKAEENRGKVAGFYVERIGDPDGRPLLPSTIQLVGPDDGRAPPDPA